MTDTEKDRLALAQYILTIPKHKRDDATFLRAGFTFTWQGRQSMERNTAVDITVCMCIITPT